jgi:hypothetical protein
MSFIQIGDRVRIYYEENCFDEGEVISAHELIVVDFYDWVERWPDDRAFGLTELFYEGIEVLVPVRRGEIVVEYLRP